MKTYMIIARSAADQGADHSDSPSWVPDEFLEELKNTALSYFMGVLSH